jgi:hypothetical protein
MPPVLMRIIALTYISHTCLYVNREYLHGEGRSTIASDRWPARLQRRQTQRHATCRVNVDYIIARILDLLLHLSFPFLLLSLLVVHSCDIVVCVHVRPSCFGCMPLVRHPSSHRRLHGVHLMVRHTLFRSRRSQLAPIVYN